MRRRRGWFPSAPTSPGSSPAGWWASDVGLEQTSGGALATATNDPVGRWLDQSGNARHLLQTTAGAKPLLQLNQISGKPCLRFDGTDDTLKALFTLDVPFQVFFALKQISWSADDYLVGGGTGDNFAVSQHTATPKLGLYNGTATGGDNSDLAVGSWGLLEVNAPNGTPNGSLRVNQGTGTSSGAFVSAARGGLNIGSHVAGVGFGNWDIAEIILYTSVLSGAALTAVYAYLSGRYGL